MNNKFQGQIKQDVKLKTKGCQFDHASEKEGQREREKKKDRDRYWIDKQLFRLDQPNWPSLLFTP